MASQHDQHTHGHQADNYFLPADSWTRVRNALVFVAIAGWAATGAGWALDAKSFYSGYLLAFLYGISIAFGATFYVMVQHLTGSAWSVTVRRIMENLMRTMPVFLLLFVPVVLGIHHLYEWSHTEVAAKDPLLKHKLGYLNETWFVIRGFLVIGLLSVWALLLWSKSRAQDDSGHLKHTLSLERWSAPGVIVLFLGGSVVAFDWIMSLDPHWFSTMFGVIFLAGGGLAFIATLILICLLFRRNGLLVNAVNQEHYHDLGKWLFALTVFWAYVSFSQYMLIWYGNLPEETIWFKHRIEGSWLYVAAILVAGHFVLPFFSMLPRAMKRNRSVLAIFAGWMLVMHYTDLCWQVMPVFHPHGFGFHWVNLASLVAVAGTAGVVFWSGFRERPLVPVGDPRLKQSLAFHNA